MHCLRVFVTSVGLLTVSAKAQVPPDSPVAKTAAALAGSWRGEMTAMVPNQKPESFPWRVDCTVIALGSGALCHMSGHASIGPIEQTCLLAYDPGGQAVHYMCVTSMGEVHDHKGQWRDDQEIDFEPLKTSMTGQSITETVRINLPGPKSLKTSSEVTMPDGSTMKFEFVGTRQ